MINVECPVAQTVLKSSVKKQMLPQLDSAADVHLSGERNLFVELQETADVINIGGINTAAKSLRSALKGVIRLRVVVEGEVKFVRIEDVYYVAELYGTVISQGVFTKKGMDVRVVGCQNGICGTTSVLKNGKVVLEAFQEANSTRTYIRMAPKTSDEAEVANQRGSNMVCSVAPKTEPIQESEFGKTIQLWLRSQRKQS